MSLKYNCSNCGADIITVYLHPGDTLYCPACKVEVAVPENALETESGSSIRSTLNRERNQEHSADAQISAIPTYESVNIGPTEWGAMSVVKFILASFAAALALSCVVGIIIGIIAVATAGVNRVEIGPNPDILTPLQERIIDVWTMIIISVVPVFLIYYSVVRRHRQSFFEALRLNPLSKNEVLRYIKIGGGYTSAIVGLLFLFSLTPLKGLIPEDLPISDYLKKGRFEVITFSIRGLIAPFSEEVVFRGYIYQGLKNSFGIKASAVAVSIIFTLVHGFQLAFSPVPLLFIGFLSALLIYIRIKTDSLTKCIAVHFIYNVILVSIFWAVIILFGFGSFQDS